MKNVDKVEFSSKEEQYENLIKTAGNNWKIFDGDANPLYDAYFVETTAPKYVKEVSKAAKKMKGCLKSKMGELILNVSLLLGIHSDLGLNRSCLACVYCSLLDF